MALKGTPEWRENIRKGTTGLKKTWKDPDAWKASLRSAKLGDKNPNWRGGICPKNKSARANAAYKNWRRFVFERDGFKCVSCGDDRGGNLEADHIKPFAAYPKLRYEVTNGRTLCVPCHRQTETWGNRAA